MTDIVGTLASVVDLLAKNAIDIRSIIQINTENQKTAIELQLIGKLSAQEIKNMFTVAGFEVDEVHETENKLVR